MRELSIRSPERRVVVTGMGAVTCIGNTLDDIAYSLKNQICGIRHVPEYAEMGLKSQVAGIPNLTSEPAIPRKIARYMGDAAIYAYHSMCKALEDAQLPHSAVSHPRTGLIVGSGIGSGVHHLAGIDILRARGADKIPPYLVPRVMGSTTSACLSTAFGIQGVSFSITSACATSAHCIGQAAQLIQSGKQDIMFAGGSEEVSWTSTALFDAMGALSTAFNHCPQQASRPYAIDRDGFVIAGGGGMLVLESLAHATERGAHIYAELVGFGATSDGMDMVNPHPNGAARAMRQALTEANTDVDYVNTHATSTPNGDLSEIKALNDVFGPALPAHSSTKGMTGHPIAAAAVHEAIYCLLMLNQSFIAGSTPHSPLDPAIESDANLLTSTVEQRIQVVMSNSFGFGGTNASLIFRRAC
ncbi:beta-ketoacyl synthase N-terminal-like domain-containing protein [Zoogloeaceae bacterium G21618-S1]|nr:beta-ketoacyl synthase N-terminal-like domain-containing protein [Zoogloeaceae bacterium G21618-S1]